MDMVVTIVSIGALIVVAAAVAVVFRMFLATQEAKFSSKEVGLLFAQLKDSLGEFRRAAEKIDDLQLANDVRSLIVTLDARSSAPNANAFPPRF